jgi:hypothetical protein
VNGRRGVGLASTDLPLLLFLLSAGLAVWPAYDRNLCWPSLTAITAGVALYFAVSRLPASSVLPRVVAAAAVVSAAALGAYFISQYSHLGYAGKIGVVDRVATGITRTVPSIGQWAPHRNSLATGLEGMLFVAIGLAWTERRRARSRVGAGALGLAGCVAGGRRDAGRVGGDEDAGTPVAPRRQRRTGRCAARRRPRVARGHRLVAGHDGVWRRRARLRPP